MLITNNTAKLYCLNWIAKQAETNAALTILDLGCGTGKPFAELLKQYPTIRYVGIEPIKEVYEAARKTLPNATIIHTHAYDLGKTLNEKFDVVVSFSAFEHVYKRREFLQSSKDCLKPQGHFLINYDAGHFVVIDGSQSRIKTAWRRNLRAYFGDDRFYRSFVKLSEFQKLVDEVGLTIREAKSFNTWLKAVFKFIPEQHKDEFMQRWLDLELWINEIGTPYDDTKAFWFLSRNYIIQHA